MWIPQNQIIMTTRKNINLVYSHIILSFFQYIILNWSHRSLIFSFMIRLSIWKISQSILLLSSFKAIFLQKAYCLFSNTNLHILNSFSISICFFFYFCFSMNFNIPHFFQSCIIKLFSFRFCHLKMLQSIS